MHAASSSLLSLEACVGGAVTSWPRRDILLKIVSLIIFKVASYGSSVVSCAHILQTLSLESWLEWLIKLHSCIVTARSNRFCGLSMSLDTSSHAFTILPVNS